jgi:hypothetical protein
VPPPLWLSIFLLLVVFLAFIWNLLPAFDLAGDYADRFRIEAVTLESQSVKTTTYWRVSGTVLNPGKSPETAPDLHVMLKRGDDTVAAETIVDMQDQALPAGAALRFQARLQSGPGETLAAVVVPIKPGEEAE